MERTLTFKYTGLTQTANLMLCLTPPDNAIIGKDRNLVAWKTIIARPGNQQGSSLVLFSSRYGVGENELDQGNKVQGSIVHEMTTGQSIDLLTDAPNGYTMWGIPYANNTKLIKAYNKTNLARTMTIGTVRGNGNTFTYEPTFVWDRVGAGLYLEAQLTPKIQCYVNLGYQETEIIRADISSDLIYTIDLEKLSASSTFIFAEGDQGGYTITQLTSQSDDVQSSLPKAPSAPAVKINYRLKLGWKSCVDEDKVESTLGNITALCNTNGLVCNVTSGKEGDLSKTLVLSSRKGMTAKHLYDVFAPVLASSTDSNWTVSEERWANVTQEDGKDVLELIAPKSLAWYYAK